MWLRNRFHHFSELSIQSLQYLKFLKLRKEKIRSDIFVNIVIVRPNPERTR